jgi:ATP-dependent protease HslVU (ClpYQ) ATPase subunit
MMFRIGKDRLLRNKARELADEQILSLLLPKDCEKETVEKMRSFLKKGRLNERYIEVTLKKTVKELRDLLFFEAIERPKKSEVILIKDPAPSLKDILSKALGILVVVDKEREIYFIDNIKFHIDTVKHLEGFL